MASNRELRKLLFLFICFSVVCFIYLYRRVDETSFVLVLRNGTTLTFNGLANLPGDVLRDLSSQQRRQANLSGILGDSIGSLSRMAERASDMEDRTKAEEQLPTERTVSVARRVRKCSNDENVMDRICSLWLAPAGEWEVPFDPASTEHHVKFEHETMKINIEARACHCDKQVRMSSKDGAVNSLMWILQSGQSVAHLYVVDDRHRKQWVYSKYTLILSREKGIPEPERFNSSAEYQICELHQDCDMQLQADSPCGLQWTGRKETWKLVQAKLADLPLCTNAYHKGYWILPCIDCSDRNSCFWKEAVWATRQCLYDLSGMEEGALQGKFSGKTLLFFGDSTMRGMMYYLIERINGSLQTWEVSHNTLIYTNVNGGNTTMCFMYFPQFWLPVDQRNNSLERMLQDFSPLQNTSNTVLIVGGVQWPNMNTLKELEKALKDFGLTGIRVVVKGYGSGFNVPAAGILFHNQEEQERVASKNQLLMDGALLRGYLVLDTFWMTVSRFKHALYGKCACHFHQVISMTDNHYHVTGDINQAYSDILIQILT